MSTTAQPGDIATIKLAITLEDGRPLPPTSTFDTGDNIRFRLNHGWLTPFVHQAVVGMTKNENKKVTVPADEAYGPYNSELVVDIPQESAWQGLRVGDKVKLTNGLNARVTKFDESKGTFTIDANHPLSGRSLNVDVTLQEIESVESGKFEVIHLAAGCFWGLELAMQRVKGIVGTAVGYTQGAKENPTYSEVCSSSTGHTEAVECIYDPKEVKLEEILDVFWGRHNPTQLNGQGNDIGTQYRGGIYYTSEEQKRVAEESKARVAASGKYTEPIVTEILPAVMFWKAEDYHQQYLEKGGQIAKKNDPSTIRCYG